MLVFVSCPLQVQRPIRASFITAGRSRFHLDYLLFFPLSISLIHASSLYSSLSSHWAGGWQGVLRDHLAAYNQITLTMVFPHLSPSFTSCHTGDFQMFRIRWVWMPGKHLAGGALCHTEICANGAHLCSLFPSLLCVCACVSLCGGRMCLQVFWRSGQWCVHSRGFQAVQVTEMLLLNLISHAFIGHC